MARRSHGRIDLQSVGLIAALATAVLSAGVFAWLMITGPGGSGTSGPEGQATPAPPSIADTSGDGRSLRGRDLYLEFTDEDDPQKVIGSLRTGSLDPLPGRHYDARAIDGWIFLDDGRSVRIEAPRGKLYIPTENELESGILRGGVRIDLYDPVAGATHPDPDSVAPAIRARTPELRFDFGLSELSTDKRLVVRSDRLDFAGSNVRVLFNKPQQRLQFLEVRSGGSITLRPEQEHPERLADADEASGATDPGASEEEHVLATTEPESAQASATQSDRSNAPGSSASGDGDRGSTAPAEAFYRAVMTGQVEAVSGSRRLSGDELEIWLHTIDNKLPENTFGEARARATRQGDAARARARTRSAPEPIMPLAPLVGSLALSAQPTTHDTPASEDLSEPAPSEPTDLAESEEAPSAEPESPRLDEPLEVTWSEGLTARFLEERPSQLDGEHLVGLITAAESGIVTFEDEQAGANGRCAAIEYLATSRRLVLTGPGRSAVMLESADTGRIETGRVEIAMGTGIVSAPGPGQLSAIGQQGERSGVPDSLSELTWTEQADFQFLRRDDRMTDVIREAWFQGAVEARQGSAIVRGGRLNATFRPRPDRTRSDLERIVIEDRARARDELGRQLAGDRLTVEFDPDADRPTDPTIILVDGDALASGDGAELRADHLEATLVRASPPTPPQTIPEEGSPAGETPLEGGGLDVDVVRARGGVRLDRAADQLSARSETLVADARLERARLEGQQATISVGQSELTGTQIELRGGTRQVEVFGAGTFAMHETGAGPEAEPALFAAWSTQMFLDDDAGTLDCYGNVNAVWRPEPRSTDSIAGEHLHVDYEPEDENQASLDSLALRSEGSSRQILRVRVVGGEMLEPDGGPAIVQSLTEKPPAPEAAPDTGARGDQPDAESTPSAPTPQIERLLRLQGPEIHADNVSGTIRVDHPGRLIVADHELDEGQDDGEGDGSEDATGAPDAKGSALFTWQGSMLARRESGTIDMRREVTMNHLRLGDQRRTELLCEDLTVTLELPDKPVEVAEDPRNAPGTEQADAGEPPAGRAAAEEPALRRVVARGAVHLRSGPKELLADAVDYNAAAGVAEARAAEDNLVTYFDAESGAPVSARVLWWDLIRDRIEARQPGAGTGPR